jgi:nucleotide-binding universal stress UspA family protein
MVPVFQNEPAHHERLATNVRFGAPCGLKSDVLGTLRLVRSCTSEPYFARLPSTSAHVGPAATQPQTAPSQEARTMSIKRILLPLPGSVDHTGEINMALSAGKALGAHVEALFISEPPPPARARMSTSEFAYVGRTAAAMQVDSYAEDRERIAREARERFAQACAAKSIPMLAANEQPGALPTASWHEAEGSYAAVAAARAAAFDLIVAASAAVMESLKAIAEQSLLQTRRPVLLAPSRLATDLTDTAMIAWDESPECWHAVSAAIPFLRLAKSVQVVSVDRDADRRSASQAEALAYLRCHDIAATARVIEPHLRSAGDTLLAAAGEGDVGLLVMGAYSHSRLREMLLGGVTRHILQHAMARPVLLAH